MNTKSTGKAFGGGDKGQWNIASPKTRSQIKTRNMINTTGSRNDTIEKMIEKEKKKATWNSLKEVEEKLVTLESQYQRAKSEATKKRIRILIDIYEQSQKRVFLHAKI